MKKSVILWTSLSILVVAILLSFLIVNITERATATANLYLRAEDGSDLNVEKVLINGKEYSPSQGRVLLQDLPEGRHELIVIADGINYPGSFSFTGNDITLSVPRPANSKVTVWSSFSEKPIPGVKVFIDGEGLKCTTDAQGTCSLITGPGSHVFQLQGSGIFHEEIRDVSKGQNSYTFKIARKTDVSIKVTDELNDKPIENADIYFNGQFKGSTDSEGIYNLQSVNEDSHTLRAEYKGISKIVTKNIVPGTDEIIIKLSAPRSLTIQINDKDTGRPIDNVKIYLEGLTETYRSPYSTTDNRGRIDLVDIKPGSYRMILDVPTLFKPNKQITIGSEDFISETFDMPHPEFESSISCQKFDDVGSRFFHEGGDYGQCTVTLKNLDYGNSIASQDTTILLFVFIQDRKTGVFNAVDRALLDFGKVLPGETKTLITNKLFGFTYGEMEFIGGVLFEGWKYTPEDRRRVELGEISVPIPFWVQLEKSLALWCADEIESCIATIIRIIGLAVASDEQVKENVIPIGTLSNGIEIYKFNYKGSSNTQIGALAQQVETVIPEAITHINEIKYVDYNKILHNQELMSEFLKLSQKALD